MKVYLITHFLLIMTCSCPAGWENNKQTIQLLLKLGKAAFSSYNLTALEKAVSCLSLDCFRKLDAHRL